MSLCQWDLCSVKVSSFAVSLHLMVLLGCPQFTSSHEGGWWKWWRAQGIHWRQSGSASFSVIAVAIIIIVIIIIKVIIHPHE